MIIGESKLNINKFIGRIKVDASKTKSNVKIKVTDRIIYQDYEVFNIEVINNAMQVVQLDNLQEAGNIYIQDEKGIDYIWVNNEYMDEELTINEGLNASIAIKFNKQYNPSSKVVKIVFSKIIVDNSKTVESEIYI